MVGGTMAEETGTAVGLLLDESGERRYRRCAIGVSGAEYGDDGQADGGGNVHGPGIISEKQMTLR